MSGKCELEIRVSIYTSIMVTELKETSAIISMVTDFRLETCAGIFMRDLNIFYLNNTLLQNRLGKIIGFNIFCESFKLKYALSNGKYSFCYKPVSFFFYRN